MALLMFIVGNKVTSLFWCVQTGTLWGRRTCLTVTSKQVSGQHQNCTTQEMALCGQYVLAVVYDICGVWLCVCVCVFVCVYLCVCVCVCVCVNV